MVIEASARNKSVVLAPDSRGRNASERKLMKLEAIDVYVYFDLNGLWGEKKINSRMEADLQVKG